MGVIAAPRGLWAGPLKQAPILPGPRGPVSAREGQESAGDHRWAVIEEQL